MGPLGYLRPLPPHPQDASPTVGLSIPGASHTSLGGRSTFDRSGRLRRTWNLTWSRLTEDEETYLQSLMRGSASASLRLMDPRKRNLLPADVASCGNETKGVTAFTDVGAATPTFTLGGVPTEFQGMLAGRLVWNTVTNTQTLYGTKEKLPIVAGSTYRISAWVKTTTTFRFSARPFNLSDVEQAVVTDATNNASTAGVWTRLSWLYTPAAGIGSAYVGLTATGSGNIETVGWMAQVDESLLTWTFGYGCPLVYVAPSADAPYWRTKYHGLTLQVSEV
jgi:hypothetical protein